MYLHINKIYKMLQNYKIPMLRVLPRIKSKYVNFDYLAWQHIKSKGKQKGSRGYGWPSRGARWCTRQKISSIERIKSLATFVYVGITADETHRLRVYSNNIYPLAEWGWTGQDCLNYCYSKGFTYCGIYNHFSRVSCFCCPLQSTLELHNIYIYYPEIWSRLEYMHSQILLAGANTYFKKNITGYGDTIPEWRRRFETLLPILRR